LKNGSRDHQDDCFRLRLAKRLDLGILARWLRRSVLVGLIPDPSAIRNRPLQNTRPRRPAAGLAALF